MLLAKIAKFPGGFREMALEALIGLDIVHIIDRICDYMSSKIDLSKATSKVQSDTEEDVPDIFDTCSLLHVSSAHGHMIERNICLAIILFAFSVYSMMRDSAAVCQGARQALTKTLPLTRYSNQTERDCLIWIYMTTIESWRTGDDLAAPGRELMRQMTTRFVQTTSWPALNNILKKFFWYEPLARQWFTCWQQGMQSRPGNTFPSADSPQLRRAELRQIWEGKTPIRLASKQSPEPPLPVE